jgi:hypothetical protein
MNANPKYSDFALDIALKKIDVALKNRTQHGKITIDLVCDVDDTDQITEYEAVMRFLEQVKIIKGVKSKKHSGYVQDNSSWEHEMLFFSLNFTINPKNLTDFLVSTSRSPKYSVRIGAGRRIVINNTYVLCRPQLNSENFAFIEYCLKQPNGLITKELLRRESSGRIDVAKRFHSVLENLKFTRNLKDLFFPHVGNDAVVFRNHVTMNDLKTAGIDVKKIDAHLETLQKYELN